MIQKFTYRNIDWLDLESPTPNDIERIKDLYNVHNLVCAELHSPTFKPRVDLYDNLIYIILHFPIFDRRTNKITSREVDFILGKDFIITTHYEKIEPLHELTDIFELEMSVEEKHQEMHGGFIFFYILRHLYESLEKELHIINDELENIEEGIFNEREHDMVMKLSVVGRHLLDFRKSIKSHSDILSSFESAGRHFYGDSFGYYLTSITGGYYRIWNKADASREMLYELRETNDSLLSTKTNDIMKFLTIMAFVTFPLSLVASVFGMNTIFTPLIGTPYDFWIIILIMAIATLFFFVFFKYKKWL